jgi:outer membrane protein assembly factor BamB
MKSRSSHFWLAGIALMLAVATPRADDWPQWRGPNRDGVWNETGIIETFPPTGLKIRWRAPVGGGLSSPVVAGGRVYVTDSEVQRPKAWERVQCFDETTGRTLWTHSDEVNYPEWGFDPKSKTGPGATPIVEAGHIFSVGATSQLVCLDALQGAVVWKRNLIKDYGLEEFENTTPSPLIDGDLLILVFGGKPDACVVAFDKHSGREVWRALEDRRTYSSPVVISAGGKRQLIIWTPAAVTSLDPATGRTWWRERLETQLDHVVATPVFQENLLLVSGLMFQLNAHQPAATVLWPDTTAMSRRILSQTSLPLLRGGHVFSDKSFGHLVCLEAQTGKQVWQNDKLTAPKNGACIHLTPNGDSILIFTDQGNLIRARLSPRGYEELSRVHLIEPTYTFNGRTVVWPPPAYANRHIFARNDQELVCASLAANGVHAK